MMRPNLTSSHIDSLSRSWAILQLATEAPDRFATWDAILLTAGSERQASLYEMQLALRRRQGLIHPSTLTLVVPDPPQGHIGSGGATLNALRSLAQAGANPAAGQRVLIIHGGGESRRVPWASILGKPFVPFPLLADPDRGVLSVFDHLLAISASFVAGMTQPGLLTLCGDVLPIFDPSSLCLPQDASLVVTTPITLDIAHRHGVIVADASGRVIRLLQKASPEDLCRSGALVHGGTALLDTGIYLFQGKAFHSLLDLAQGDPNVVDELLQRGCQCSLYEEIASAMVPNMRSWTQSRPIGKDLLSSLETVPLFHARADDMAFVHFGSTNETMAHLASLWDGRLARRILAETGGGCDEHAAIYASQIAQETQVGSGSMVFGCRLASGVRIGTRCAVVNVDADSVDLTVPANCCLWQASIATADDSPGRVTVCCGVEDNPKDPLSRATFCNRRLSRWLWEVGADEAMIWRPDEEKTLWTARLFPVGPQGLSIAAWMMAGAPPTDWERSSWLACERHSLASLQSAMDPATLMRRNEDLASDLIIRAILAAGQLGLDRNVSRLGSQLDPAAIDDRLRPHMAQNGPIALATPAVWTIPRSRFHQMQADLMSLLGDGTRAAKAQSSAFEAVAVQVAASVESVAPPPVSGLEPGKISKVELPLRFDFAGGWSDTPPFCLERPARVLNMAITLDGQLPVGASVEALSEPRWEIFLDQGETACIADPEELRRPPDPRDPMGLIKTGLVLTGYGSIECITQGVRIRTWSQAPRGSGLGASSVLGAALITSLQQLASRPADPNTVSRLVLVLEQRMGTGGGWQDQVGGLYPGIKCATTVPVTPLIVTVDPVPLLPATAEELSLRFVQAYTGVQRLAKNILQIVVRRYLQRDRSLILSTEQLVALADDGRRALAKGDLDTLGEIMAEVWQVHQQLDPHCSNAHVDAIFREVQDLAVGAKLAGAGGGGFMGILAKTPDSATQIRRRLSHLGQGVRVYNWSLHL